MPTAGLNPYIKSSAQRRNSPAVLPPYQWHRFLLLHQSYNTGRRIYQLYHTIFWYFPAAAGRDNSNPLPDPEIKSDGTWFQMMVFRHVDLSEHQSLDRKSTRLNSSHVSISYAVFCLKKKIIESVR